MFFQNGEGQVGACFLHSVGLDIVALEGFDNFTNHLRGNGGSSAQEDSQTAVIVLSHLWMVDHQVEHSRYQVSQGHPLLFDGLQNDLRLELSDHHVGSSNPCDSPGRPGMGEMEKRCHMNPYIPVGEMDVSNGPQGMGCHILMR